MPHRPLLEIDGVEYPHVYEVSYEIYTSKDETGRPTDRAHFGVIKITIESAEDGNVDIARWAMDTSQPNWKSGKVTFYNKDSAVMKELSWTDGFITKFAEKIPHVKEHADEQIYQYFEISANSIMIADAEILNYWDK
ncbi:MAG: type VI secretion system tube protein TssD [candidate division Zixibacteria bacterium]|nr:type VI secretion system tube protein TssD [candidate division Zixibacteria bacterium]